jgi:peptide/nickel transport system substrate-binding protein
MPGFEREALASLETSDQRFTKEEGAGSMATRKTRKVGGLAFVASMSAVAVIASLAAGGAGAGPQGPAAVPRNDTLYTSGKQWGPYTNFNPLKPDYNTGTVGLVYETLFRYDPLKDRFIPWLASGGKWVGRNYVVTVRKGVKWSDGKPLTAGDVKFTFETQRYEGAQYGTMWKTGLQRISTRGRTVNFHFRGVPNYQEWDSNRYTVPIVPRHIWKGYSQKEIVSGNTDNVRKAIGTGPFTYGGGAGGSQTLQWNRRSGWWATKAYGLKMPMKYIVDIHNTSNTASLQNFLQSKIDLSNNFFPGINRYVGRKVGTYYRKAPYMLAANTAWLVPNTTKAPLSDAVFRRALAESIDVNRIVVADYSNIVSKASPTGLLPTWNKWVDQAQVKKLGFSYSTSRAKSRLAAAGYRDRNGDGFVEDKDGSTINLRLIVPKGWSDWETAIQIIADSAKDAGIKISPAYPDFNGLVEERNTGKFELVINNEKQIGNTPYTYYDYLFRLPLLDQQTVSNFQRFSSPTAWALAQQLNKIQSSNVAKAKKVHSQIQKIMLEQLPAIPLWYNGMWAQYNTSVWTNFPTASGNQATPSTWNGYLNMTGIDALAKLKKK